ncbi:hypothetical protein RHDC3_02557 [Rhodocyclaceae bacterium]|nr:hypothetical protein RHDC3_02557 [Rhodocyclaceae bacterium]
MSLPALDNLVRIGQLKAEPRNDTEIERMMAMARSRLADAKQTNVSLEGRFTSAYNAAHAAALAALRWHGYRSENRITVFQSLAHTLNWPAPRWRVLDVAHQKRNMAEYEGFLEVEESAIVDLCDVVAGLIEDVAKLVGE